MLLISERPGCSFGQASQGLVCRLADAQSGPAALLMAVHACHAWLPDTPLCCDSFRLNVRKFLKSYGRKVDVLPAKVFSCWILDLQGPKGQQRVYVYEEKATEATFTTCDQCRIIGALPLLRPATGLPSVLPSSCIFFSAWVALQA